MDATILAAFAAHQLILKARDKLSLAEFDRDILALTAGKFDVPDLSDKVDND